MWFTCCRIFPRSWQRQWKRIGGDHASIVFIVRTKENMSLLSSFPLYTSLTFFAVSFANVVSRWKATYTKKLFTLLDLCVSSLRRGHANLLCIVPILTDDPRRESKCNASMKWRYIKPSIGRGMFGHDINWIYVCLFMKLLFHMWARKFSAMPYG